MEEKRKAKHIVHCRVCEQEIDINNEDGWLMNKANQYYHKNCYDNWKSSDTHSDEQWIALIFDFISQDLRAPEYNYFLIKNQIEKFVKGGFTVKGILFALKYYYQIKENKWNNEHAHGGIGIVPYIYEDSKRYWIEQERQKSGFMKDLEQQLFARANRPVKVIKHNNTVKRKPKYDLSEIGGEVD